MDEGICSLDDLGLLGIRGADARKFLQGQLSNDIEALPAGSQLRAGLHSPQGRTLALLTLVARSSDEILAVLPRELLPTVLQTLQRYVLRAKVKLSDETGAYRVYGVAQGTTRQLQILTAPAPAGRDLTRLAWRALDIAAGLPQLYLSTSGQFVAQMLNLDCIGAISFQKGCYTGQEVIARAHYRGRVKRRMQRFLSEGALALLPGDSGQLTDGRNFRVIEALQRDDGRCEFLAVAAISNGDPEAEAGAPATTAVRIAASAWPLPYALPE